MGGSIGTNRSIKSNAYVEPSEAKEDPSFISLDQASKRCCVYTKHSNLAVHRVLLLRPRFGWAWLFGRPIKIAHSQIGFCN